jgi:hypothetical protein
MALITRTGKGSPLTNTEMDANLLHLDANKVGVQSTIFWTESTYPPHCMVYYNNSTYVNEEATSEIPGLSADWIQIANVSKSSTVTFTQDTLTVTDGKMVPRHKPADGISWNWLLLSSTPQPLVPSKYVSPSIPIDSQYNGMQVMITYAHSDQPLVIAERSRKTAKLSFDVRKLIKNTVHAIDKVSISLTRTFYDATTHTDKITKRLDLVDIENVTALDEFYKVRQRNKKPIDNSSALDNIATSVAKIGGTKDYGFAKDVSTFTIDYGLLTTTADQTRDYGGL